jgi:hypothetical protein
VCGCDPGVEDSEESVERDAKKERYADRPERLREVDVGELRFERGGKAERDRMHACRRDPCRALRRHDGRIRGRLLDDAVEVR